MPNIHIIAVWIQGTALSGGDRIFIELARRWGIKNPLTIHISEDGKQICQREKLENVIYDVWVSARWLPYGYFLDYFYRTIKSILKSLRIHAPPGTIIYSASDFWPDSIPAFLLKLRNKNYKWIAGFYLFSPAPWQKDSPYKGKRWIIGLVYWITQRPTFWIVRRYADMVFVTSEPDVNKFVTRKRTRSKIVVVRGGVDVQPSTEYLNSGNILPVSQRKFDGCFVGRYHYQKGVLELIDIWRLVCDERPTARLAMIGAGPLEQEIRVKIQTMNLNGNIELLGFRNGEEKYSVFKNSKIILHPATFDSGGMAAAEAMSWELPGVSFDLEALKTYYPKGMKKIPVGDKVSFSKEIIHLLTDPDYYNDAKKEARDLIIEEWDWDKRANLILEEMVKP